MRNLYISDTHFGHGNIVLAEESRQHFGSVDAMNEAYIRQWNEVVEDDDHVWIIGDFSFRSKVCVLNEYAGKLKGHKHLIIGNHDRAWLKNYTDERLAGYFETIDNMRVIKDGKRTITLCHYPMMEWSLSRYAYYSLEKGNSWLIHGHIHDSRTCEAFKFILEKLPCALNAYVDINHGHPATFEELLENNDEWYGRNKAYLDGEYQEG